VRGASGHTANNILLTKWLRSEHSNSPSEYGEFQSSYKFHPLSDGFPGYEIGMMS
jgi:hypothetical protein